MEPLKNWAVISMSGPVWDKTVADPAKLKEGWDAIHRVEVHDIIKAEEGYIHFTKEHAKQLLEFLDGLDCHFVGIIVNCIAGVSRSAAVARYISELYKIKLDKDDSMANILIYNTLKQVRGIGIC